MPDYIVTSCQLLYLFKANSKDRDALGLLR
jgi:hypothetical protein